MGLEVERKYLVANECWRRHVGPGTPYVQGYVSGDPERSVRVRIADGKATLTVKREITSAVRNELSIKYLQRTRIKY
jgi:adenylate cyclase